jgi:hypothetical protein
MRAKLVEVLRAWMPDARSGAAGADGAQAYTRALFEGHPLALTHLVPHLLTLCAPCCAAAAGLRMPLRVRARCAVDARFLTHPLRVPRQLRGH